MAFAGFPERHSSAIQLLQRSLERGRLGHAYLFVGSRLDELEPLARTLAKTLNCEKRSGGKTSLGPVDCCDRCLSCRKIDEDNHPDVSWLRPESKLRVIKVDQVRELIRTVNLKPTQADVKVGVIVAADRLKEEAANAFLKTLEEPPARSVLVLLTTDPSQILETILSRCLRLNFSSEKDVEQDASLRQWLGQFGETAAREQGSLLSRYRLLTVLLKKLADLREVIQEQLQARSKLEKYEDVDPRLQEQWEDELKASIEAEYRRQRADLLIGLEWWLRDVWLQTLDDSAPTLAFPDLRNASGSIARRITSREAVANLRVVEQTQSLLQSNVQEALTLEVGLLKLRL